MIHTFLQIITLLPAFQIMDGYFPSKYIKALKEHFVKNGGNLKDEVLNVKMF